MSKAIQITLINNLQLHGELFRHYFASPSLLHPFRSTLRRTPFHWKNKQDSLWWNIFLWEKKTHKPPAPIWGPSSTSEEVIVQGAKSTFFPLVALEWRLDLSRWSWNKSPLYNHKPFISGTPWDERLVFNSDGWTSKARKYGLRIRRYVHTWR